MWGFTKTIVKVGLIGLVVGGAATAILGKHRVSKAFHAVKDGVCRSVDGIVPEGQALHADMEELKDEYPRRIAELEAMLQDIDAEIMKQTDQVELYGNVVAMVETDLDNLQPQLEAGDVASINFRGGHYTVRDAQRKGNELLDVRDDYQRRLNSGQQSLDLLRTESEGIRTELGKLRYEYEEFLDRYHQLQREIEMIKTTDKLIELAERRQRLYGIDNSDRLANLASIEKKISQRRSEQMEKMKAYGTTTTAKDYETRARFQQRTQDVESSYELQPLHR
ncbi:MAG: hypothetical protein RL885_10395 [Planctomycetota bacterium]